MTGMNPKTGAPNLDGAACKADHVQSEWFFECDKVNPEPFIIERARSVCAICPVQVKCLDFAMKHNEIGLWGGLTTSERKLLKRKQTHKLNYLDTLIGASWRTNGLSDT